MIYARKLNGRQRAALCRYEGLCGLEPIGQDDLDAGALSFAEVWELNIRQLEDILADVSNIDLKGTGV